MLQFELTHYKTKQNKGCVSHWVLAIYIEKVS
jgi:hypothetical protein